jgi:beta-1,2-mannobiose phosphorylase / 1,2-beta-oligomannan phosphorylase
MFVRHQSNPVVTSSQVKPSRPDFEVIGAFNAGVTEFRGETLMLLRIAERPKAREDGVMLCPYLAPDGTLAIKSIATDDPAFDTSDPRILRGRHNGEIYLTSISHLRLARSTDGLLFTVEPHPWLTAQSPLEAYGVEDARVTPLGGRYYINYSAVSAHGIATALVSTPDFKLIERHGIVFPPSNRDVVIFPQRVSGLYAAYHRPMPGEFGRYSIWSATSPDLVHWGNHKLVLQSGGGWEAGRVGGGAPPLWTERGWLSIYHAADQDNVYCLGAFLTPHDDVTRVIARSRKPFFRPEADYEVRGFFGNVVFTCGALLDGDTLRLYYGAADDTMALAVANVDDVLNSLTPEV